MPGISASLAQGISAAAVAFALVIAAAPTCAAQTVEAASASTGGIKVHGHWTIEVRDPDGTVVSRDEIQNAFNTASGGQFLAQMLAGTITSGAWVVAVGSTPECHPGSSSFLACTIAEPSASGLSFDSHNLTATVPTTGANAGKLVLRGSVRAPTAMTLHSLQSMLWSCPQGTAPAACVTGAFASLTLFSGKALAMNRPVVADQVIDATVVISFTSTP
jgi:hypothetical protein